MISIAEKPEVAVLKCGRCGHEDVPRDEKGQLIDAANTILRCDECGARIAYGVLSPRVMVNVSPDRTAIRISVDESIDVMIDRPTAIVIARAMRRGVGISLELPLPFKFGRLDDRWSSFETSAKGEDETARASAQVDNELATMIGHSILSVADPSFAGA